MGLLSSSKIPFLQGYTFDIDLDALMALGVPASKVVYGIMPGHSDARRWRSSGTGPPS